MGCGGWHGLAEPVLAEPAEIKGVQETGQHSESCVGDQGLAGELGRRGSQKLGTMVHRNGDPFELVI